MSILGEARAVADYWEGHPEPPKPPTPQNVAEHSRDMAKWREKFAPDDPPDPPAPKVPGPPTPGAGMPAVRLGDLTAHGGTIGPFTTGLASHVYIGGKPAACMGDPHVCPMFDGPKPHAGGTITKGSSTVFIGNKPAARVSDVTECKGPPGAVAVGESNLLIGDLGGAGAIGGAAGSGDSGGAAVTQMDDEVSAGAAAALAQEVAQVEAAYRQAASVGTP